MNCKYYRTRTEKKIKHGFCLKDKKKVCLFCKECEEYKKTIEEKMTNCRVLKQLRQKSKELTKLERNRFSILVSSTKCCMCPSKTNLTWHEVFRGKNRANSMRYGLCLRLCYNCHEKYQEDKDFNEYWHIVGQKKFMEYYHKSVDEFIDVFGKNYL